MKQPPKKTNDVRIVITVKLSKKENDVLAKHLKAEHRNRSNFMEMVLKEKILELSKGQ